MEKNKIRAVLFDLDGTIVKINWDMTLERKAVMEFAARHELEVDDENVDWLIYKIRKLLTKDKEKEEYIRTLAQTETFMIDKRGAQVCEGAKDILRQVKFAGMKTAIVSNNMHESAGRLLENFGLRAYFDTMVCYDDVAEPKPAPEGILEALRRLKVKPEEALFVGDGRQTDLLAAQAAGVEAFIIQSGKIGEWKEKILGRI